MVYSFLLVSYLQEKRMIRTQGFVVLKTKTKEIILSGFSYFAFAFVKNLTDPPPALQAVTNGWSVIKLEADRAATRTRSTGA